MEEGQKQDDVVLIQEGGGNKESKKKTLFDWIPWISMAIGLIISITAVMLLLGTYTSLSWVLIGLLMIFHGLIGVSKPPESYSLDITISGKQFSYLLPLRHVLSATANTVIGIAGVVSLVIINTDDYYVYYNIGAQIKDGSHTIWDILGFILIGLLLLWALISSVMIYFNQSSCKKLSNLKSSEEETYLRNLVTLFNALIPMSSISFATKANFREAMNQERKITRKPVHIMIIVFAMILCVLIFATQLWFDSIPCKVDDCLEDLFDFDYGAIYDFHYFAMDARFYRYFMKDCILISTPVAFLLCTLLLVFLKNTDNLRMLLSGIISFMIGIYFLLFSSLTVQFIIMMAKFSLLPKVLHLTALLPVPILAAVFIALAYTNIVQLKKQNESGNSSNSKGSLLSVPIYLSVFVIFLSLTTMIISNLTITSAMQVHWNFNDKSSCTNNDDASSYDPDYTPLDRECFDFHGNPINITEKPEKCYGKIIDCQVMERMKLFSISQLAVSGTNTFFSLFVILSGTRITKKSLFIPGILMFASAAQICIASFNGLDLGHENSNLFLIMNGLNTLVAFAIGLSCLVMGSSVFIFFLGLLFRLTFGSMVLIFIILFTFAQSVLTIIINYSYEN